MIIDLSNNIIFLYFVCRAAEALKQCGPLVTLQVLKDAANRQGLSALLAKPSENHHHLHQQQAQSQPQLARFPATSNPSLLSHQHSSVPSTHPLKTTSSHERLLTHSNGAQHPFATLGHPPHHHHQHQNGAPAIPQPRPASRSQLPATSSSYEFVYNAKSVPITNNNNNSNHHHYHQQPAPVPQQRYIQNDNQHRLIQPARSAQVLIDEETNDDIIAEHISQQQQHQSNPNLFHSNQIPYTSMNNRNQTFDIPKRTYDHDNHMNGNNDHHMDHNNDEEYEEEDENDLQPTNFVRSASERQSFGDRNLATTPSIVYREDVPPPQNGYTNGNHHIKPMNHTQSAIGPSIAPKPLPKPMISALALIKQTNSVS